MLEKQNDTVQRLGRVSDFTWMVPGMGVVFLPKGFTYNETRNQWRLVINKEEIAARCVNDRSHRSVLEELIDIWRSNFKSTIANPDRGYMLTHHVLGREVRGRSGIGGVIEIQGKKGIIGYVVYTPHDNSRVYIGIREFRKLEYALTFAMTLRERSMRKHEIALKYRGLKNANC